MKKNLSSCFFNFGLFKEGLKRLRVIGVATAIISLCTSVLNPVVSWMQTSESLHQDAQFWNLRAEQVCIPLYFVVIMAPFFILTLFSFLHKRKESDFFHAIPYTRTCVYVSFSAAALSFIFAIQLVSAIVGGILWEMHPTAVYDLTSYIGIVLTGMLSATMLASIMAVAISLTGTKLTTVMVFGIFCLFTRIVSAFMSVVIKENIDVLASVPLYFLSFDWFLPIGYFASGLGLYSNSGGINHLYRAFNPLHDPACIIYSVVITLLAFTLGGFFYGKRKSEMAGNTTSNRIAQHVFRCLFTLPIALIIPLLLLSDDNVALSTLFIILVITLVTYYLYELITTKRVKNLVSATPWLLVLLGGILLFTGAYHTIESIILNTPIKNEDVVSVNVSTVNRYDSYQAQLLYDEGTKDTEIISMVCNAYALTQKCDKKDNYTDDQLKVWREVTFELNNGREINRYVCFTDNAAGILDKKYIESLDIEDRLLEIPKEITGIRAMQGTYYPHGYGKSEAYRIYVYQSKYYQKLYDTIYREYVALSDEDKAAVRHRSYDECIAFSVHFRKPSDRHDTIYIRIYVDEKMPESFALIRQYAYGFPEN